MIQLLLSTFLLISALWAGPLLVNRFTEPENNSKISKIYYVSIISIYLTLLFSNEFYLTTYLGWAASTILLYDYIKKLVNF